ncbi:MAG: hypothetical protein Q3972_07710 [Corynebacterium sp.]|nr:hypothetical protein [Corynebacterium sp.]
MPDNESLSAPETTAGHNTSRNPLVALIIAIAAIIITLIIVFGVLLAKGTLIIGDNASGNVATVTVTSTSTRAKGAVEGAGEAAGSAGTAQNSDPSSSGIEPAHNESGFIGTYTTCTGGVAEFMGYAQGHGTVVLCRESNGALTYKSDWDGGTLTNTQVGRIGGGYTIPASPYTITINNDRLQVSKDGQVVSAVPWTWYSS